MTYTATITISDEEAALLDVWRGRQLGVPSRRRAMALAIIQHISMAAALQRQAQTDAVAAAQITSNPAPKPKPKPARAVPDRRPSLSSIRDNSVTESAGSGWGRKADPGALLKGQKK